MCATVRDSVVGGGDRDLGRGRGKPCSCRESCSLHLNRRVESQGTGRDKHEVSMVVDIVGA